MLAACMLRDLADLVGELFNPKQRVPHHWATHNLRFHGNATGPAEIGG